MVIQDLHNMHTPGWLLALLCSYLSSRVLVLTYQNQTSTSEDLTGGYGAGTWIGGFLFIIKFNGICLRPPIPRPNGNKIIKLKFVDDSTKASTVNFKKSLIPDTRKKPFPLTYYERTQSIIDPQENVLQLKLDRFQTETTENHFVTNKKRTFVMVLTLPESMHFLLILPLVIQGPVNIKVPGKFRVPSAKLFWMG